MFVHSTANPSVFKTHISISAFSSTLFPCLIFGTQIQSTTIPNNELLKLPLFLRSCSGNYSIFNFCSEFLVSYLFHCLSNHHPPLFTVQYKSRSYSLCMFFHSTATPSVFKTHISISACSSTIFSCSIFGTQNKHK